MSLADVPWQTRSSRVVYQNPWIRVDEDQVQLPNWRMTVYGVVQCGECVGVLPFLDEETVVLIRRPWTLVYVTVHGNVLPCCISPFVADPYEGIVLGNLFEQSLEAIWCGDGLRDGTWA